MKQTGRMKLNKFHVRDRHARAPGHCHAISGRDVRIGCVEINFATTTSRKDDPIRTDRFHFAALFIENVNAEATIFRRKAKFRGGD